MNNKKLVKFFKIKLVILVCLVFEKYFYFNLEIVLKNKDSSITSIIYEKSILFL